MGLDKGTVLNQLDDILSAHADLVDYVKLGWGTSVIDPILHKKLEIYKRFGIPVCLGGTLFELAHLQNKMEDLIKWASSLGIEMIEVSDGTITLDEQRKLEYITSLANEFRVVSEFGSKDAAIIRAPRLWAEGMAAELAAGAWKVIAEGRESGTAGLYRGSSEIRGGLVDEIAHSVEPANIIWEAPQKLHQTYFVEKFGANVNLGNIALDDLVPLETLRLGLRSDTLLSIHT